LYKIEVQNGDNGFEGISEQVLFKLARDITNVQSIGAPDLPYSFNRQHILEEDRWNEMFIWSPNFQISTIYSKCQSTMMLPL
jgi:hypothetical protein